MGIKDRQERDRIEMQKLILNAATDIFKTEGLEKLSIRKIADKIEYSPAIIYHYFKDKDDIISHMMKRTHTNVVQGITSVLESSESSEGPDIRLKRMTRKVIEMALQMPEEYKAVQLNSTPGVLEHTASLFKGAAEKKQALGILFKCLKEIYNDMDDSMLELTAQIIWSSTFGLIIKLIIEKDISEEQRNNLIEHHIRCIIDVMVLGKSIRNL